VAKPEICTKNNAKIRDRLDYMTRGRLVSSSGRLDFVSKAPLENQNEAIA